MPPAFPGPSGSKIVRAPARPPTPLYSDPEEEERLRRVLGTGGERQEGSSPDWHQSSPPSRSRSPTPSFLRGFQSGEDSPTRRDSEPRANAFQGGASSAPPGKHRAIVKKRAPRCTPLTVEEPRRFQSGGASPASRVLEPRANDFPGGASSAPTSRKHRAIVQRGGAPRGLAPVMVEEPDNNAIEEEGENGDEMSQQEPANPRANRRHTNRSRKSRINPNSQGQLYEKYMQAKIRAEEMRAENYATGAEANRAARQAAEDQSQASRDSSRAMQAVAIFFENENRRSSSSSGIVYPSTYCSG